MRTATPAAAAASDTAAADKRYMRVGRARSQASFARLGRAGGMGLESAKRNKLESSDFGGFGVDPLDRAGKRNERESADLNGYGPIDPFERDLKRNDQESADIGGYRRGPFDGDASVEKRFMRVGRFARLG